MTATCNFGATISLFRSIQGHKLFYMYFDTREINCNIAILTLTSPGDIQVATKSALVLEINILYFTCYKFK